jgi:hypothetical protein
VLASFLDRVEIGDIHPLKPVKSEKRGKHLRRGAGGAKARLDRTIGVALSLFGMDNRAAFQIKDRYDLHPVWNSGHALAHQ